MNYCCLPRERYAIPPYALVPLRYEDIMAIKEWRNQQMDILRQSKPLTEEAQERYYQQVIRPSFEQETPDLILFSYLKDDQLIGYGGLTNIHWEAKRAEVSFLLETERSKDILRFQGELAIYLTLLKIVTFEDLKLNRLFTEAYDIRPYVLETLEQCGFCYEGRMREHVRIHDGYVDSVLHGYLKAHYEQDPS